MVKQGLLPQSTPTHIDRGTQDRTSELSQQPGDTAAFNANPDFARQGEGTAHTVRPPAFLTQSFKGLVLASCLGTIPPSGTYHCCHDLELLYQGGKTEGEVT